MTAFVFSQIVISNNDLIDRMYNND